MADTQLYKLNIQIEDRASSAAKKIQDGLDGIGQKAGQAAGGVAKIGEEVRQASAVAPRFNTLGVSLQQMVRELPAFTMSLNTGFLAVSNNIPILVDAISMARRENALLVAQGKTAIPVWRQLAGSLFSWQTILVLGITALSAYGDEISGLISEIIPFNESLDRNAEIQKQLDETRKKGIENVQQEITKLNVLYSASQDESRSKNERLSAVRQLQLEYPGYFKNLAQEEILAGKGATAYRSLAQSMVEAATARASMDKMTENASRLLDLNEEKEAVEKELNRVSGLRNQLMSRPIVGESGAVALNNAILQTGILEGKLKSLLQDIGTLEKANQKLSSGIKVSSLEGTGNTRKSDKTNKDLTTTGGIINKINILREAQSKASGQQQIDLEKEIRLWQEKLNLMELAIAKGAAGNLADSKYKDTISSSVTGLPVPKKISIPVEFDNNTLQRSWQIMKQQFSDSIKEIEITGQQIGSILTGSIQQFASGLGEALVSGNGLEIFKSMLTGLMDMLSQFGAALIAAGTATFAFKSMFANPIAAIITGTALVAATAAAKAALQNATAFANGGIVSGPTLALVGEYSGARNNPEVIAPLDKLQSMIEPARMSFDSLYLETKVRGKDLYVALQGVEHKNVRTR